MTTPLSSMATNYINLKKSLKASEDVVKKGEKELESLKNQMLAISGGKLPEEIIVPEGSIVISSREVWGITFDLPEQAKIFLIDNKDIVGATTIKIDKDKWLATEEGKRPPKESILKSSLTFKVK